MLVSIDRIAARIEALPTISQFTSSSTTAEVPMVATAVCAIVFTALMNAAANHFLMFSFVKNFLLSIVKPDGFSENRSRVRNIDFSVIVGVGSFLLFG